MEAIVNERWSMGVYSAVCHLVCSTRNGRRAFLKAFTTNSVTSYLLGS